MFLALLLSLISAQPDLPPFSPDAFPPAAREPMAKALKDAAARPGSAEAVGRLARLLHAWEQWEAAHSAYERLQRIENGAFDWWHLDGVVLQRLARHDEAAARFAAALAIKPRSLPARVRHAEALFDAGRHAESRTLLEALIAEPAAEPVARLLLGRIEASASRHEAAIVHLRRAVELFPELGAAHYALALSYRSTGRTDDARRALALHKEYGPRWPAIPDDVLAGVTALKSDARAHVDRGMKLANGGDLAEAIAAHEAALALEPSLADAHSNLISLYGRAGNWSKAEEHYRKVVTLGVNLADAHYDYGVLLGLQEKWELAAEAYGRALAVNPLHAQAGNNLGQALERQKKLEEALAAYRATAAAQPGFRLARFNLGRMLIALGRPEEAVAALTPIVEPKDEEAPRYLFALSVAHVRAGRREVGIKWAAEAKQLALEFDQRELAAAIERDLAALR